MKSKIALQTESSNIAISKEEDYLNFCSYKFLMIIINEELFEIKVGS